MGKYGTLMYLTREFREDTGIDVDKYVTARCLDKARGDGYHAVGDPRLDWHEMSRLDVEVYYFGLGMAWDPGDLNAPVRPGDWQVRAVLTVAEDAELPTQRK